MKKWLFIALLSCISGCSKVDNFANLKMKYQQECFGDVSVSCRSMLVDLNVAKLEAGLEKFEQAKDVIISCNSQKAYEEGIQLIKEYIDYYQNLKPNFFVRMGVSGSQVEFNPPPFKREHELAVMQSLALSCKKSAETGVGALKS